MERHPIFAAIYDPMMAVVDRLVAAERRRRVAREARGRVLEIGIGTGLNVPLYRDADALFGLDPDPDMLRRAKPRAAAADRPVHLVSASAEDLPFASASFDTVVASLVFCTIPDARRAAAEVRRVLAPSGRFVFFEHVRSTRPGIARFQDGIAPAWRKLFAGCHPNRDTLELFAESGLAIESFQRSGPGILVTGSARSE
jgi:ubiquinone/menaquinone biosynthesis C-methylase UbiE